MFEQKLNELFDNTKPIKVEYNTQYFNLPIEYIEHNQINDIIKEDIEFKGKNHIYNTILPNSILNDKWGSIYTVNKDFLKQTQLHIKNYQPTIDISKKTIFDEYKKFKEEGNFMDKYQYMSINMFKHLNKYTVFLHLLGLFNLSSPALSLLSPIIALIIPFFIFKLKGLPITMTMYCSLIKKMITDNNFFKLFNNFSELSSQQKVSSFISIFFYIFQIYSNIISCINFYNNLYYISDFLNNVKDHLKYSIELSNKIQSSVEKYNTYSGFYNVTEKHKLVMKNLYEEINVLLPYNNTPAKLSQLGIYMKIFYNLYFDNDIHNTFMYSIFLNQYDMDISSLHNLVKQKQINKCKYDTSTSINNMFYLPHLNNNPVKNSIDLKENIIITGPNASGKTTILKSLLINILMSQQFGYGCYGHAKIKLYDTFHSYLNIPDTSGRDSLFQAEARRCKDILENITDNNDDNHFCIFDEIYSGTNPNDAVLCANLYLKGLNHYKKCVDYALTTHYIQLCENFNKDKIIKNLKMNVDVKDDKITYLYNLISGISYIHGGKHILKEMNYPEYLFNL